MGKAGFVAEEPRTLDDFVIITGLKVDQAKKCFDRFGGYAPALASFAQSYASLPDDYFQEKEKSRENIDTINDQLKLIYRRAREVKKQLDKSDGDVWSLFYKPLNAADPHKKQNQQQEPAATQPVGAIKSVFGLSSTNFASQTSTATSFNFGFGSVPSSSPVKETSKPSVFSGFGQTNKQEEGKADKVSAVKEVKPCEPSHFTGAFFDMPLFWREEVEGRCPLLNLNDGFLDEDHLVLRARLKKWLEKASFYKQPVQYIEIVDEDEETVRVIIKDADRTFFHPDHRKKFVAFLNAMSHEFKAYGQAMSYLAGICLLVLTEEETAAILRFVAKVHIPGHWAAEAVGFATSAWVVEHFMKKRFPDVAKHLGELKFWPDTYLQKILTGLCIHVLNFRELFDFLDLFIEGGLKFLIKFCLSIVEHFRGDILRIRSSNDANTLYEIMRLDSRMADVSDVRKILKRAPLMELGDEELSIDVVRSMVYEEHVAPRLKRAPKTETFEPCEVCEERRPKWWNDELGAVCDECKDAAPGMSYTKY
uniref:Putative GTPase activating protein n=1 Tax=Trypanosoma congolense (strain IL3000) TaxID=1068625 RepID=G0UWW7_TRYCI|nr:putative GTPase activating protein [Trypanosoma congolense IL3000]